MNTFSKVVAVALFIGGRILGFHQGHEYGCTHQPLPSEEAR